MFEAAENKSIAATQRVAKQDIHISMRHADFDLQEKEDAMLSSTGKFKSRIGATNTSELGGLNVLGSKPNQIGGV